MYLLMSVALSAVTECPLGSFADLIERANQEQQNQEPATVNIGNDHKRFQILQVVGGGKDQAYTTPA